MVKMEEREEWRVSLQELRDVAKEMVSLCTATGTDTGTATTSPGGEHEERFGVLARRAEIQLVSLGMKFKRAVGEVSRSACSSSLARSKLHSESEALGSSKYILNHYTTRVKRTLANKSKYTSADLDVEENDLSQVTQLDERCKEYKAQLVEEKKQRNALVETFRELSAKKEEEQLELDENEKLESLFVKEVALQKEGVARIQRLFERSKHRAGISKSTFDQYLPMPLQILLAQAAAVEGPREWCASIEGTSADLQEYLSDDLCFDRSEGGGDNLGNKQQHQAFRKGLTVVTHPLSVKVSLLPAGAKGAVDTISFHYYPELNRVFVDANKSVVDVLRSLYPEDHGKKLEKSLGVYAEEKMGELPEKKKWKFPVYLQASKTETMREFAWAQQMCGLEGCKTDDMEVETPAAPLSKKRKKETSEEAKKVRKAIKESGGGLGKLVERAMTELKKSKTE